MINLMIHTPVNTRARVTEYIKSKLSMLENEFGEEIIITSPHDYEKLRNCQDNWIDNCIRDNNLPDMVLTHACEFSTLLGKDMKKYFSPLGGEYVKEKPVRDELVKFMDEESIFYPIFIVPIIMCYNKNTVDVNDLTGSWNDLFNPKYKSVLPDKSKPITKVVGAHIISYESDKFKVLESLDYIFSPKAVMKSLMMQEHDIAVTNTAFLNVGGNNIRLNPTKEGVMLLPQVIAFKKGADRKLLKIIDLLLELEIQNYFGENGYFPSNPDAIMGKTIELDEKIKNFTSWDHYLEEFNKYDCLIGGGKND